jgi:hypothetical protein
MVAETPDRGGPQQGVHMSEPVQEHDPVPVDEGLFALRPPGAPARAPLRSSSLRSGEPYAHFGVRATPEVS